jgi:hypothetical protein
METYVKTVIKYDTEAGAWGEKERQKNIKNGRKERCRALSRIYTVWERERYRNIDVGVTTEEITDYRKRRKHHVDNKMGEDRWLKETYRARWRTLWEDYFGGRCRQCVA